MSKVTQDLEWMKVAKAELGTKEIVGPEHNSRVIEYHATTTLKAKTDEVPWCSSFVNWVLTQAGYKTTKSAAARSWIRYGTKSRLQYGAIVVTSRGDNPVAGHVGFCTNFDGKHCFLLGGNQSNSVSIIRVPLSKILAVRMPVKDYGDKVT